MAGGAGFMSAYGGDTAVMAAVAAIGMGAAVAAVAVVAAMAVAAVMAVEVPVVACGGLPLAQSCRQ
jgi:hypothetical protein